jgi:class 3 adenylate cyclase
MPAHTSPKKTGMPLPTSGHADGFAMIVDINGFVGMVATAESTGGIIAQFTRDVLAGAIESIESVGGEVVGFMGDAILGIIPTGKAAVDACYFIAKDVDGQCEWISKAQKRISTDWEFSPGGPSVKIAVEYGRFDVSTIRSRLLGEHRLFIGSAINYAARISRAGVGNRCLVGPQAAGMEFSTYPLKGPHEIAGKPGEENYSYYFLSMDETWIEGPRKPGKETYWN